MCFCYDALNTFPTASFLVAVSQIAAFACKTFTSICSSWADASLAEISTAAGKMEMRYPVGFAPLGCGEVAVVSAGSRLMFAPFDFGFGLIFERVTLHG
jgi:hypothetical protein